MSADQTNTAEAVEPAFVDVVQRILDENSAWVAAPSRDVVNSIAIRAFVAARMAYEDMHTPATEMMRQRDDAREQRDAHFKELERASEIITEQRLEADRLRSRIMELEKALASRVGSRSGPAMTAVVAALHERPDHEWTTAEVLASAPAFVSKQIYNALGYLVRHGRLNKSGYGRYRLPADRVLTEGRK